MITYIQLHHTRFPHRTQWFLLSEIPVKEVIVTTKSDSKSTSLMTADEKMIHVTGWKEGYLAALQNMHEPIMHLEHNRRMFLSIMLAE